jgi:hypothetical protein
MMSRANSIPTTFQGLNMRSRLEAKWAHVFDQLGWKWHYEPLDFDGWIPDFVIDNGLHKPLLVDVKPATAFPWNMIRKVRNALTGDLPTKYNVYYSRLSGQQSGPRANRLDFR